MAIGLAVVSLAELDDPRGAWERIRLFIAQPSEERLNRREVAIHARLVDTVGAFNVSSS